MNRKSFIELRVCRLKCGLNQQSVANLLGVTVSNYSSKENGKVRFYLEEAIKITERFNYILKKNGYEPVSVENLFYRKSYK